MSLRVAVVPSQETGTWGDEMSDGALTPLERHVLIVEYALFDATARLARIAGVHEAEAICVRCGTAAPCQTYLLATGN